MSTFHDAIPTDWIEPGQTTAVEVEGTPVAIANVKGDFFAFENFCPHQGTVLGGLDLMRDCLIRCPQHGSIYDVRSGECVLPSDDGFSAGIRTFATRVEGEAVQVSFD